AVLVLTSSKPGLTITRRSDRSSISWECSTSTLRCGSQRSICCSSSRWSAVSGRAANSTSKPCANRRLVPRATSSACPSTANRCWNPTAPRQKKPWSLQKNCSKSPGTALNDATGQLALNAATSAKLGTFCSTSAYSESSCSWASAASTNMRVRRSLSKAKDLPTTWSPMTPLPPAPPSLKNVSRHLGSNWKTST